MVHSMEGCKCHTASQWGIVRKTGGGKETRGQEAREVRMNSSGHCHAGVYADHFACRNFGFTGWPIIAVREILENTGWFCWRYIL